LEFVALLKQANTDSSRMAEVKENVYCKEKNCLGISKVGFSLGGLIMIDYDKWDEYYDGGFATDEPIDSFWEEYDLTSEYEEFDYGGQKINVTVEQIMKDMGVKAITDKFLYRDGVVVVLLDYSKGIFDRWKNGAVLYCNGEQTYSAERDMNNLSIIDRMLFNADSIEKTKVRVFWKDRDKNYKFINGLFVLSKKPYQIEEEGKYRWVFPLSLISEYNFRMPEEYSFYVDTRRIKRSRVSDTNKDDEINLVEFNEFANFDSAKSGIYYKCTPQKKNVCSSTQEKIERSRKTAENALILADFKCELDNEHFTFIRKNQNVPYTEAHHLVPLAYSELFSCSLDVEENIVSLCSTCHNQIHYGKDAEVLIRKLYASRKELLRKAGIVLSEQELLEMYGIKE